MKKIGFLIPVVLVAFAALIFFTGCKHDYRCTMRIVCRYYDNIDTGDVVKNAHIVVGKEEYDPRARAEGYTNDQGVFEHIFDYPALLDVMVTYNDTLETGEVKYYTGAAQVQMNESETTEKIILMMETQHL